MACRSTRRLIDAYFDGALAPGEATLMRAHARECPGCRRYYDQLAALEQSLAGEMSDDPALHPRRSERLLDDILGVVLDQPSQDHVPAQSASSWLLRLLPAAAVIAAIAVVLLVWPRPEQEMTRLEYEGHSFSVRGFTYSPHANRRLGVRMFCITPGGVDSPNDDAYTLSEISNQEIDAAGGSCPRSGVLFFTASNLFEEPRELFLFGIDERLEPRWYYPKPGEGQSRRVAAGALDATLGKGIVLHVNHQPGTHRVVGLFTERPIRVEQIEEALAAQRRAGATLDGLRELMVGGGETTVQFSLRVGGDE